MAKVVKKQRELNFKPNYLYWWMLANYQMAKDKLNPALANAQHPNGQKVTPVFVNLGGTRSSKTFDEIHLIYTFLSNPEQKNIRCIVYRDTLVLCRKYTLDDFKQCFNLMGLLPDVDYSLTGEISGSPKITIIATGNVIDFMGYPEDGKQAGQCQIALINEVLDSDRKEAVENILQRCTMFAMIDANPNKTVHFIYDKEEAKLFNWFFSKTTYMDNMHLPEGLQGKYESKCPWDFRDSKIMVTAYNPNFPVGWVKDTVTGKNVFFNGFKRRVWTKEECPENYVDQPYPNNKYRAPHPTNTEPDRFWWLTMGEGEKASREGAIFKDVIWIKEFPKSGFETTWYSADWGYTHDNTVLVRTGYSRPKSLTCDIMVCEPTRTPQITYDLFDKAFQKEAERRKAEGEKNFDEFWICCDSADAYMGENWVEELNNIAYQQGKNYNFFKISKGSISARVDLMKMFELRFVEHDRLKKEVINYTYLKINDISTNQPDPNSRFCDCLDAIGYGVWQSAHGLL